MLRNTQIDFRRNNGAQQGARANDHGCHDPCSEQHGSRQPRSWLILNVGQNMKIIGVIACLVGTVLARAETRTTMPPLEEIVAQSWVGIDQGPPHGIYRLVVKKDGTGRL